MEAGGVCGQSFAWKTAKAAMRRVFDTRIGNKGKPWTDSIRGACMVRAFVPVCNTVVGGPGWSSSHARLLVFL